MSASAIFITDTKGKVIISRNYRGDVPMSCIDKFSRYLTEEEDTKQTPVIHEDGVSFAYLTHNNLIVVACTKYNANVLVILTFLSRLIEVLEAYFKVLNEESIRDNFVVTYELLDEMMDFGYPQVSDSKILQEFILVKERHEYSGKVIQQSSALTNSVSWRKEGIVHKKNEVFLDVIEKLNILVAANGSVIRSEIEGTLQMRSFLSGMPELKMGLNDKILMDARAKIMGNNNANSQREKSVEMEDIRFHQCVQLARFENDRTISFIPPDGEFVLMSYRLNTSIRPLIWVEATVEPRGSSRVEYMVKVRSNYKRRSPANDVEILIPVPSDVDSPTFKTSIGSVEYVPEKDCVVWKIKQLMGQKEYLMRASFGLPSITAEEPTKIHAPIKVHFELPYYTVSGIQVRYLKITEKSRYNALPWVRYLTQNGDYEIRM